MPLFNEVVAAAAAKRDVGCGLLVFMDFKNAPRRWWSGFGELRAGGQTWLGLGTLISVDGIEQQAGTSATEATFTLSGVDAEIVALARESSENVVDRRAIVYLQFFHTSETREDESAQVHGNLDQPLAIWSGTMGSPRFSGDLTSRTIVVPAETLWADKNKPPFGLFTDRSQKGRFPGDRGCERVASLTHKSLSWPATS